MLGLDAMFISNYLQKMLSLGWCAKQSDTIYRL